MKLLKLFSILKVHQKAAHISEHLFVAEALRFLAFFVDSFCRLDTACHLQNFLPITYKWSPGEFGLVDYWLDYILQSHLNADFFQVPK